MRSSWSKLKSILPLKLGCLNLLVFCHKSCGTVGLR
ncbi:MAG: hypothetical protein RLZZ205_169, partial [Bacteroidota bacterium]